MEHHRQRTKPKDVAYSLYLYFLGLSYRNTAKALSRFVHRSHVSIWKWIQKKNNPKKIFSRKMKIQEILIDETLVRVKTSSWFPICLALIRRRTERQADSCTRHIHGKKHACRGEVCRRLGQDSWETPCLNGWRNMVSAGLSVPKAKAPPSFLT